MKVVCGKQVQVCHKSDYVAPIRALASCRAFDGDPFHLWGREALAFWLASRVAFGCEEAF